jgi:hypothetical protein
MASDDLFHVFGNPCGTYRDGKDLSYLVLDAQDRFRAFAENGTEFNSAEILLDTDNRKISDDIPDWVYDKVGVPRGHRTGRKE